ncbi:DoxX family protein [Marixanthomonas spongiae]|uniref:DoxX family protein n=1 Tax=Marixanthomonas spongiae TaxID=2174845 RepID=A0A2U0HWG6_9FLAO|nr:DoxX family protein [Marixanthomonas spongiae]PVW13178.1 hypothetical protein DDV96_13805 [Marixanthomonas spongiae]
MNALPTFERFYLKIKSNRWYWLFAIFCRVSLAIGFIAAGMVKIFGERFASGLSSIHPMGTYLEALHHTGYYYTWIGYAQVIAAVLLLIPRTVILGALLYFPIIVNICILSFAVRFEGSLITAPLMVLANVFLLIWNYDKLQYILPFKKNHTYLVFKKPGTYRMDFPYYFFSGVVVTIVLVIAFSITGYTVMPRNSLSDCKQQFKETANQAAGYAFCECIHSKGGSLDSCLETYEKAVQ